MFKELFTENYNFEVYSTGSEYSATEANKAVKKINKYYEGDKNFMYAQKVKYCPGYYAINIKVDYDLEDVEKVFKELKLPFTKLFYDNSGSGNCRSEYN